jgi:hypothetical protein
LVHGVHALVLHFSMQANDLFYLTTSPVRAGLLRGEASLGER